MGFSDNEIDKLLASARRKGDDPEPTIESSWSVIVECKDESEQKKVFEVLQKQGYDCKVLTS